MISYWHINGSHIPQKTTFSVNTPRKVEHRTISCLVKKVGNPVRFLDFIYAASPDMEFAVYKICAGGECALPEDISKKPEYAGLSADYNGIHFANDIRKNPNYHDLVVAYYMRDSVFNEIIDVYVID